MCDPLGHSVFDLVLVYDSLCLICVTTNFHVSTIESTLTGSLHVQLNGVGAFGKSWTQSVGKKSDHHFSCFYLLLESC